MHREDEEAETVIGLKRSNYGTPKKTVAPVTTRRQDSAAE